MNPPKPTSAADGYRTEWLEAEQSTGGRAHVLALLARLRREHGIESQRVLELGSGLGANLRQFQDGNIVQGVEAMAEAAARANAAGIPTWVVDLERDEADWPTGSWDWILLLDVLEHLVHPEQVLARARRLLAPNGRVVVNVPNPFDWRSRWRILRGAGVDATRCFPHSPPWRYPHLRFLQHADLLGLLEESGFQLDRDLSRWQPSLPKARHWRVSAGAIAARWPDLAASGFCVVARVRDGP
jgi:SAM-dependent methyltransferase